MMEQLLAEIDEEPFEPSADGGLVNMKDPGYLGESLAIKEIRRKQEAIFCSEALESADDGAGEMSEFCWYRRGFRLRRGSLECIEWHLAIRSPVVVHITLGESCAKPSEKRTTTGVRGKRRAAFSIDLTQTIEL
jgi:hypothetical protein